jgi:hypothetical protein
VKVVCHVGDVCDIAASAISHTLTPVKRRGRPLFRKSQRKAQCLPPITPQVTDRNFPEIRLLDRAAGLSRNDIAEAERVRLMERLLSHYIPNITFDIQSLRQAVEELKSKHRDSESDAISTREDPNELEDLAIDDEHFTIKAMPDNTTRMPPYVTCVDLNIDTLQNILVNFPT